MAGKLLGAAVAALMLLLPVSTASAFPLRGKTKHLHVAVTTSEAGAALVKFHAWLPCASGAKFVDESDVKPRGAPRFRAKGTYRGKYRGGYRARVHVASQGKRDSGWRWHGRYSATAVVTRHGRTVDHCSLRSVRWVAKMDEAHLRINWDPGQVFPQGSSAVLDTPNTMVGLERSAPNNVVLFMPPYTLNIMLPPHQHFVAGRTYTQTSITPGTGRSPTFVLDKEEEAGPWCSRFLGQYTVQAVKFNRHGGLTRFAATFDEHCAGQSMHLSISYRHVR